MEYKLDVLEVPQSDPDVGNLVVTDEEVGVDLEGCP